MAFIFSRQDFLLQESSLLLHYTRKLSNFYIFTYPTQYVHIRLDFFLKIHCIRGK